MSLDVKALFREHFEAEVERQKQYADVPPSKWIRTGRASKAWPDKETPEWWLENGPMMVESYVAWRREHQLPLWMTPHGAPGIEIDVEARLDAKLPVLRGFVDRVFVDTDTGALVIVDLKFGSMPNPPRQLGIYKVLLEEQFPGTVATYGAYFEGRKGKMSPLTDLSYFTKDVVRDMLTAYVYAAKAPVFVPHPGTMCGSCVVRRYCPEMGGEKADLIPPF